MIVGLIFGLFLISMLTDVASVPQPCSPNCSPVSDVCMCGGAACPSPDACGFTHSLEGTKECYDRGDLDECWTRAFIIVGRLLCIMYILLPAIVLIMFTIGVIIYTFNADNPEKRKGGTDLIKNAIIGALIVIVILRTTYLIDPDFLALMDYGSCLALGTP